MLLPVSERLLVAGVRRFLEEGHPGQRLGPECVLRAGKVSSI